MSTIVCSSAQQTKTMSVDTLSLKGLKRPPAPSFAHYDSWSFFWRIPLLIPCALIDRASTPFPSMQNVIAVNDVFTFDRSTKPACAALLFLSRVMISQVCRTFRKDSLFKCLTVQHPFTKRTWLKPKNSCPISHAACLSTIRYVSSWMRLAFNRSHFFPFAYLSISRFRKHS